MSRKVKTPRFVLDNFGIRIWFIIVPVILILVLAFAFLKVKSNTIYHDNGVTIERNGNTIGIYNLTSKELKVIFTNMKYESTIIIPKISSKVSLDLYEGTNLLYISTDDFSDTITLEYEESTIQ